ncbi:RNA 2',3'-cyclic phosphodiesterase [Lentisphaerota bacterium WC36G]|nr:RNA 2',3'-cyclic phosphodiesterase [Lentisphaerae bacterium WC36]
MRYFIAIDIPKELRLEIKRYCQKYNKVKWQPQNNQHITMRFMGEIKTNDKLEDIKESLNKVMYAPFRTYVSGYDFFPTAKSPSVFTLSLEASKEFIGFKSEIDGALRDHGVLADRKTFKPHITLCRFKRGSHKKIVKQMTEHFADFPELDFEIDSFHLYESRLTKGVTTHTKLESYSLY